MPKGYELLDCLRQGPSSTVWEAKRKSDGEHVALKVLRPATASDDIDANEARTLSMLPNRYIAPLLDHGHLDQGRLFVVTELMVYGTLRDRLRNGPCDSDETLRFVYQVARGLADAHDAQVLHLDIKPSNIGITGSGRPCVKILDFGSAVRGKQHVLAGVATGTPIYCSPEQARGNHARSSSDVYSLGCVFFEMIEGWPPFVRGSIEGYLFAHMSEVPSPIRNNKFGRYQRDVVSLVGSMLQKQPSLRPAIDQVVETLTIIREKRKPYAFRKTGPTVWEDVSVRVGSQAHDLAKRWRSKW